MADEPWKRLAKAVRRRRDGLGLTQVQLANKADVSEPTIRTLERGEKESYRRPTLRAVELALDWMPGSVDAVLDGGEPKPAWTGQPSVIASSPDDITGPTNVAPSDDWERKFRAMQLEISRIRDEQRRERERHEALQADVQRFMARIAQTDLGPPGSREEARNLTKLLQEESARMRAEEDQTGEDQEGNPPASGAA